MTTLNLDHQHITKLSNLDKLENLRWASFNDNDITKIEVGVGLYVYLSLDSLVCHMISIAFDHDFYLCV